MKSLRIVFASGLAGLVSGAACGPTDTICASGDMREQCRNSETNPVVKIIVTPDNVLKEVDLDRQESYTICYRARAQFKNGNASDVTNAAQWTLDRHEMGSFQGPCLSTSTTLTAGGIVRVSGRLQQAYGEAALIIKLRGTKENDGVGPNLFGGPANNANPAKPRLVYPLDDSMHARNIGQMNIQFHAGDGNQVFRARLTSNQLDYTLYFRPTKCDGDRCQWMVPEDQWKLVAVTNGGAQAKLTLAGTSGLQDGKVAQGDPIAISFSPEDVLGGLYYFSTSLPGILRMGFYRGGTAKKATPFIIPNSLSNKSDCAGCHAITQDGTKITATYGHGDDFLGIASGSDAEQFSMNPGMTRSNFQWFNKDGTKLISNFNGELVLRDGNTGMEISRVPRAEIGPEGRQRAVMPEWSHMGDRIVYVRLVPQSSLFYDAAACCGKKEGGDWLVTDAGEIVTINYDNGQFAGARVIVGLDEGQHYHYYPSFSPDDQWIVFNTGSKPGFSPIAQDTNAPFSYGVPNDKLVSYDQKTSRLRLVKSTGGGAIDLIKATVAVGNTTSWPKFTPFMQKGQKLMFMTYSSKMDYGFVVGGGRLPQIWMAGVDLSKIGENSSDPSYAPFWLPFQDEREANHLTIWTTKIACEKDTKCGVGEFCMGGACSPKIN